MRCSEPLRQLQTAVVNVGRQDLGDPRIASGHDRGEPDGADADNQHRITQPRAGFVQDRTGACRDPAGKWPQQVEGDVRTDLETASAEAIEYVPKDDWPKKWPFSG